jgi:hypothetical protein
VFRVLGALCRLLDDITWPTEDIELVSLLLTVLEHCTNSKRLRAHFLPKAQLMRRLQLQEEHRQLQQLQQKGSAGEQEQGKQKLQLQQQARVLEVAPAPAGDAAAGINTPATASSLWGSTPLQQALQQQQQPSSIQSMVRPVILQELTETTYSSSAASPTANPTAAAVEPASPSQRLIGRQSAELRRTPSGKLLSGVAYTRLASPPSTPLRNSAAELSFSPDPQQQQKTGDAAANGHTGGADKPSAAAAGAAAMAASSEEFSAEGCAMDPAAAVVAQQPVAPVAAQSVLGSRKALRGVTAQQLLAEPVVQALLRKLEE